MNVLGATAAAAVALELELGLELAGHHAAGPSGLADIRLGNPVAQAYVHELTFCDYEKHYQYACARGVCQASMSGLTKLLKCPAVVE